MLTPRILRDKGELTRAAPMVSSPDLWGSPLTETLALRENQNRILKILVQILMLPVTHCGLWANYSLSLIICFFTKKNEAVESR